MSASTYRSVEPSHEKNDRWAAVDHYALQHLHQPDAPFYSALEHATRLSEENGLPSIEVSALQGKFLATQCMLRNAKHVLEVGTLGGYSTIWLAASGPEVRVTTIEIDEKHHQVAKQAFATAGLEQRIEALLGAGTDVLARLREEVDAGTRPKYDLVFIDADKTNNLNYFNEAVRMCNPRACIIVDNVVRQGRVAVDALVETDSSVAGARQVIEAVGSDERVLGTTLMQIVGAKNYDGFLLTVLR